MSANNSDGCSQEQRLSMLVTKGGLVLASPSVTFVSTREIASVGISKSESGLILAVLLTWADQQAKNKKVASWRPAPNSKYARLPQSHTKKMLCYVLRFEKNTRVTDLMRKLFSMGVSMPPRQAPSSKETNEVPVFVGRERTRSTPPNPSKAHIPF